MISRAFGTQAMWSDQKGATKTYAGEKCDERTFGSFSICSMQSAPAVPLHVSGSLLCVDYEQTATAVKKGDPPASDFAPPAGVTFQRDSNLANPDSMARGFVKYLASQELADSLAKAKSEMASRSTASNASATKDSTHEPTPEEREQQRKSLRGAQELQLGQGDVRCHQAGILRGRPRGGAGEEGGGERGRQAEDQGTVQEAAPVAVDRSPIVPKPSALHC